MDNNLYTYHVPVMLPQCLEALDLKPDGIYVDVTFGGGGHSRAIVDRLTTGKLYAFDKDPDALVNAGTFTSDKFQLMPADFRFLARYLKANGILKVDGILADLGVSSHQFDEGARGFSIRFEGPLDMRMNPSAGEPLSLWLRQARVEEIQEVLSRYGEVRNAKTAAMAIQRASINGQLETTAQLANLCQGLAPRNQWHKYQAQVFQAFRIYINDEMGSLEDMLQQTVEVLKPGGRLVVMSYHSLEDRLVKNLIQKGNIEGNLEKDVYGHSHLPFESLLRKPIEASEEEVLQNPRARSAKLRIAIRNDD